MDRSILPFARTRQGGRASWFPAPATYVHHEGEQLTAVAWRLQTLRSGDLLATFDAAVVWAAYRRLWVASLGLYR